ncbi:KTSC domain-containing protein [Paraburkholderia rhizosphaerae]|uniref:KTSC domain-containing protein n=1 Tax=Paraburkholderia rhizosphaerae TaxID=480658 RepID=A0A4R8LQQ3_9BURK|nr:KTSC domain-containing protein [Paraburkholderia rhizosphaerae]TDY49758.1 KTSC domain-containing protein [Paraburkholderia rhizosphaerae]
MEMVLVMSSAIRAVGYDPQRMHMRILFQQGHSYDFCRVPEHVYRELLEARSKGSYYNDHIRDKYPC